MADTIVSDGAKIKKFYQKWWFWVIVGIIIIAVFSPKDPTNQSAATPSNTSALNTATAQAETDKKEKPTIPTEYVSALAKATQYANTMDMSKQGVYDQLVSEYGEKFTPKAAKYAIEHVKADWKANALAKAKTYQDEMSMSPAAIRDQLVSKYGEKFTEAEADYAIKHLNE